MAATLGKTIHFLWYAIQGCMLALLSVCGLLFLAGRVGLIQHFSAYVILSGSMSPTIPVGSIVISQRQLSYVVGDVITFEQGKSSVTHRVANLEESPTYYGDATFTTKGDANKTPDASVVPQVNVAGKVLFTLPYLGYIVDYAKSPKGFLALVIIPATIIIYEELKNVRKELARLFQKLRTSGTTRIPTKVAILPVIAASFLLASVTKSYFFDSENTQDNFLGAAASYDQEPQIAQTLVINEVLPDSSCSQGQTEAQWLEVFNGFSTTVNLKNFKITDGTSVIDLVTSNTNVPAGAFALLAHNSAIWNNCYSDNGAITANLGGQLDIDTEFLQLQSSTSAILDTVQWGGTTGLNPTQNQSIEREPDGLDTASGASFAASDFVVRPTPMPGL